MIGFEENVSKAAAIDQPFYKVNLEGDRTPVTVGVFPEKYDRFIAKAGDSRCYDLVSPWKIRGGERRLRKGA